ncbi:MAG: hypothetical protein KBC64_02335 [Simkaniaceae bacterium]|nr:hypothetical protein [Simkaniaceae bacterium]
MNSTHLNSSHSHERLGDHVQDFLDTPFAKGVSKHKGKVTTAVITTVVLGVFLALALVHGSPIHLSHFAQRITTMAVPSAVGMTVASVALAILIANLPSKEEREERADRKATQKHFQKTVRSYHTYAVAITHQLEQGEDLNLDLFTKLSQALNYELADWGKSRPNVDLEKRYNRAAKSFIEKISPLLADYPSNTIDQISQRLGIESPPSSRTISPVHSLTEGDAASNDD